ncbi:MAG TPA: hypothetical protein DIW31_08190 [Bacteroidales bacterium]|nr:hypothetical protein [Bacteroidales bacterium]
MQTNYHFSIQRFIILIKYSLRVNKKTVGISLAGISGILFLLLLFFQKMSNFQFWSNQGYIGTFIFFFFSLGALYSSSSFPAFRSKEKSIAYLTLPASTSEKYFFELLTRVIGYIILMPLLFWVIANIEGSIAHYYEPSFINYKFSFKQALIDNPIQGGWKKLAIIQSGLFVFIAAFAGASHFKKSPLVKSLFMFSIIVISYFLYIYLLHKGLNLDNYTVSNHRMLFFKSEKGSIAFFAIVATIINLSLLAIAWFRLKEREV